MKHFPIAVFLALCAAVAGALVFCTGCRTSEANYKKAYEKAAANQRGDKESTIYTQYRRMSSTSRLVIDGDTLDVRTEFLSAVPGDSLPGGLPANYSVAVGRFKQIFNARSMKERVAASGYPGALILRTGEPLYYVMAATAPSASEILPLYKAVLADTALRFPPGYPQVVHAARNSW